jgi:hypothetical protein
MRSLPSSVAGSGAGSKKDMMVISFGNRGFGDGGVVDSSRLGQLLTLIPSRSGDRAPLTPSVKASSPDFNSSHGLSTANPLIFNDTWRLRHWFVIWTGHAKLKNDTKTYRLCD